MDGRQQRLDPAASKREEIYNTCISQCIARMYFLTCWQLVGGEAFVCSSMTHVQLHTLVKYACPRHLDERCRHATTQ